MSPRLSRQEHFEIAEQQLRAIENLDLPPQTVLAHTTAALAHATLAAIPVSPYAPDVER